MPPAVGTKSNAINSVIDKSVCPCQFVLKICSCFGVGWISLVVANVCGNSGMFTSSETVGWFCSSWDTHRQKQLLGSCSSEGCVLLCSDLILSCICLFCSLLLLISNPPTTPMLSFHLRSRPHARSSTSVPEVNGLQEPSLAKRLRGTPERIELENYRLSLQREEELEEVPEETLAEHNLSSVLDKATDADLGSR